MVLKESNPEKTIVSHDLEIIRQRVIDDLLEPAVLSNDIQHLTQSIQQNGSWPDIDYKDVSRTGFQHSRHLQNMFELSRAFKKPGSPFHHNPKVLKTVSSALDFWISNDFICENWWWNEMGTPGWMINTLLVLDSALTERQRIEGTRIAGRANLEASGARPGGDLIQIAAMLGKQGLFKRDEAILERVIGVMADEIKVTTGRGLKPDMSFHHRTDNVICTLSYGNGYASSFSYWAVKIAGTKFTFPKTALQLLTDYYLDGICKSMIYGKYPDPGAKNRDLSRKGTLNPAGAEIAENLLKASDYRKEELEDIVKIRKDEKTPDLRWNRFFWHSEYFTHQRNGYFSSVRMHSSRNHNMEQPHNEEGLKNHHVADGSNFISLTGKEYLDIFPVWDWQKIPGTTIVQKPDLPHWREIAKKGLTDFVGGVSDGEYGSATFDFSSPHDSLKARKAWFFFDAEYVSLGAGIRAAADYPVLTTLNQCLLNNDVVVKTKKGETVLQKGQHKLNDVSWVFHDGIGYLFTSPEAVNISNSMATGKWSEITHQTGASNEIVQKEVFSLWLDHGIKPDHGGYQYIVVPGIKTSSIERYGKNSPIKILSNTTEIQAVTHTELNLSQVVFYEAGKIKINDQLTLTTDNPGMVMVKMDGKKIQKISVSDPTHKLNALKLSVNTRVEGSGKDWQSTWDTDKKVSVIKVTLPSDGFAGKSISIL